MLASPLRLANPPYLPRIQVEGVGFRVYALFLSLWQRPPDPSGGNLVVTYRCSWSIAIVTYRSAPFLRAGMQRTPDPSGANVVVYNTCSIRDHAEQKVYPITQYRFLLFQLQPTPVYSSKVYCRMDFFVGAQAGRKRIAARIIGMHSHHLTRMEPRGKGAAARL